MRSRSPLICGSLVLILACMDEPTSSSRAADPRPRAAADVAETDSAIIIAAGDIHTYCDRPWVLTRAAATAAVAAKYPDALVIPMGDLAGEFGTAAEFQCYDAELGEAQGPHLPRDGQPRAEPGSDRHSLLRLLQRRRRGLGQGRQARQGVLLGGRGRVADLHRQFQRLQSAARRAGSVDEAGPGRQSASLHHGRLAPAAVRQQRPAVRGAQGEQAAPLVEHALRRRPRCDPERSQPPLRAVRQAPVGRRRRQRAAGSGKSSPEPVRPASTSSIPFSRGARSGS